MGAAAERQPADRASGSVTGVAETVDDAALKARYLAVHPYAALYAGFGDFALWRVRPLNGLYVGGFGARRGCACRTDARSGGGGDDAAAEADIIAHCNADHPDAMAAIAGAAGAWRMVGSDVDGCDLACGERVVPRSVVRTGHGCGRRCGGR